MDTLASTSSIPTRSNSNNSSNNMATLSLGVGRQVPATTFLPGPAHRDPTVSHRKAINRDHRLRGQTQQQRLPANSSAIHPTPLRTELIRRRRRDSRFRLDPPPTGRTARRGPATRLAE